MSRDDLRSNLVSSISLAAEAGTFLEYALANRSTWAFAAGHLAYLAGQSGRISQELQQSAPTAALEPVLIQSRTQVNALSSELSIAQQALADPQKLSASHDRIMKIRTALQQAESSL
jgi:hypothetical protein